MTITVYSTTTCPYCVMLKQWLDQRKVDYVNYMVDQNPYAAQMLESKSGQRGVPFTTVEHEDGRIDAILGFDREKLQLALATP